MKGTRVVFILPSQWRGQGHGSHWFHSAKKVVAAPKDLPLLPVGALWFDVPTDEEVTSSDASNSDAFLSADEGTIGESPTAPVSSPKTPRRGSITSRNPGITPIGLRRAPKKPVPGSKPADEDASDEDASDEDASDEDASDEDPLNKDTSDEYTSDEHSDNTVKNYISEVFKAMAPPVPLQNPVLAIFETLVSTLLILFTTLNLERRCFSYRLNKVNAVSRKTVKALGLQILHTHWGAATIDGARLDTYGIVLATISVDDKYRQTRWFEETFLIANISQDVVLGMPFLQLADLSICRLVGRADWIKMMK
ncbi:hypothetical protein MMC22_009986 [Lobaria immixta]|nr:hypothetical protein [Lobaria immixta]